jgi:hypothetical protein
VTPAAISLLLVHLKKKRIKGFTASGGGSHALSESGEQRDAA